MSERIRLLMTAYDYRPRRGGVATCAYELARAMAARDDVSLRMLARAFEGGEEFDRAQPFETRRLSLPGDSIAAAPLVAASLAKELLRWRPDAVLHSTWVPGAASSWLAAPVRAALGVPYFTLIHGVECLDSDASLRKRVRSRLAPLRCATLVGASAVFPVSRFTASLVRERCRVPDARIRVIRNGIDPTEFFPSEKPRDLVEKFGLEGKRVFFSISRLDPYKGHDRAIAALRHVARERKDFVYLVAGSGSDRERLEAISRHYGVFEHVRFAGDVPFERVRDYHNLADCFVLLSRMDLEVPQVEGFGIVFLEAAACGKPSIAGRSGGIPDAVEDGASGWLVDPTDDREIARALVEVLGDPEEASRRGRLALERALRDFRWDGVADEVLREIRAHVRN